MKEEWHACWMEIFVCFNCQIINACVPWFLTKADEEGDKEGQKGHWVVLRKNDGFSWKFDSSQYIDENVTI